VTNKIYFYCTTEKKNTKALPEGKTIWPQFISKTSWCVQTDGIVEFNVPLDTV